MEQGISEAGKRQLNGDTIREASSNEVSDLRSEHEQLKQLVAELSLKNRVLKKSSEWSGVSAERYMRYGQAEKMEVCMSSNGVGQTCLELRDGFRTHIYLSCNSSKSPRTFLLPS